MELKNLREVLQSQRRLHLVSTALQMELRHCPPGLGLRDLVNLFSDIAKTLDSFGSRPLKFRSVVLRKSISDILASTIPAWSMQERQLYLATLRALKDTAVQQHFPS